MFQRQQAKVEELQQENLRLAYGNTSYYNQAVKQNEIIDELQKRVDKALELMQKPVIVGEPAKYVCARFKEIEQALKGDQYDEHRKKAEEAISKGASLTNHRIEL
ncbi:hypothetical protein C5I38_18870 [Acinetobacter baumannii]|nr:hypothetical protein DLD53_18695 [Acinetobacter baumannii]PTU04918.1 hypothetical protein C5I38_18870 [Acinetobacter baumannii]